LRIFRFKEGRLEANAQVFIPNGYQLLYSNPTLPGMSGGAVLNAQGQLVGIHGQSETDSLMSEQKEVAVKTGTNQAIPIVYYKQYLSGIRAPITVNREKTLENDALAEKYYLDGNMKFVLGDKRGAIIEYNKAITAKPQYADAYKNRGRIRLELGDEMGAISDFDKAIEINPQFGDAFFHRSRARSLSDPYEACQDMLKSAALGSSGAKKNISSACREHPSI
jgi:tetratricopeptide (TPR) repeat protein